MPKRRISISRPCSARAAGGTGSRSTSVDWSSTFACASDATLVPSHKLFVDHRSGSGGGKASLDCGASVRSAETLVIGISPVCSTFSSSTTRTRVELVEADDEKEVKDVMGESYPTMSAFRAIVMVLVLSSAMLINILLVQAVQIALPTMGRELDIPNTRLQWLVSAYALSFGALLLLAGRLGDLYGHKRAFVIGMSWVSLWSLGIGFAPDEVSIDVMRALQGSGAALAIPAALGILGRTFPPGQSRSLAMGTFSGGAPVGASLGNVIAGLCTEYTAPGWRSVYFLACAFCAAIAVGGVVSIPTDTQSLPLLKSTKWRSRNVSEATVVVGQADSSATGQQQQQQQEEDRTVDWLGAFLVVAGLALVTFALADSQSAPNGWRTPYIPVLLVVGLLLLVAFWFWQNHVEYKLKRRPLMSTSIWSAGKFAYVNVITGLTWCCFATQTFFVTLWYQDFLLLSPIDTVVRFLPMAVTGVLINFVIAIVAARVPGQLMLIISTVGCATAALLFAVQETSSSYWTYQFFSMILTVFGADGVFCCAIMYISKVASRADQGVAAGTFNTTTQVGTALGLAIMTIIQSSVTQQQTEAMGQSYDPNGESPLPAIEKGLRAGLYGCAAFGYAAALLSIVCLRGIGYVGHRESKPKAVTKARKAVTKAEDLDDDELVIKRREDSAA